MAKHRRSQKTWFTKLPVNLVVDGATDGFFSAFPTDLQPKFHGQIIDPPWNHSRLLSTGHKGVHSGVLSGFRPDIVTKRCRTVGSTMINIPYLSGSLYFYLWSFWIVGPIFLRYFEAVDNLSVAICDHVLVRFLWQMRPASMKPTKVESSELKSERASQNDMLHGVELGFPRQG